MSKTLHVHQQHSFNAIYTLIFTCNADGNDKIAAKVVAAWYMNYVKLIYGIRYRKYI